MAVHATGVFRGMVSGPARRASARAPGYTQAICVDDDTSWRPGPPGGEGVLGGEREAGGSHPRNSDRRDNAVTSLRPAQLSEAGPGEELVLSIGGGNWEGSTAMAAGLSGRISERFSLRGSASLASGHAGVSAAMGWRIR